MDRRAVKCLLIGQGNSDALAEAILTEHYDQPDPGPVDNSASIAIHDQVNDHLVMLNQAIGAAAPGSDDREAARQEFDRFRRLHFDDQVDELGL